MNFDFLKKYWWAAVLVSYLGLGQFFQGLQPMFRFQFEAHAQDAEREMAQTNKKLDQIACLQIVANYINAEKSGDATMMAHWAQQAAIFNCTVPS